MAEARTDVAVIGAGLVGASVAYHLARRDVGRVVVVDQGPVAGEATAAGAGILSYQGWDAWDLALVEESAQEYRILSESSGRGEYSERGGVRVARTVAGAAWLDELRATLEAASVPVRAVGASELGQLLPWGLWTDVTEALYTPRDATFFGPELAAEYLRRAEHRGSRILSGAGPVRVSRAGALWTLRTAGAEVRAAALVLAAGAWTPRLLESLGRALPLAPFRTQACRLRPHPLVADFPALHDLDLDLYVRYVAPGRIVVGDGTERRSADPDRFRRGSDASFVRDAVERVRSVATNWDALTSEDDWAGLCVASPDRYPVVGAVPGEDGLFVATGFNGFGAMRAGAIGRLLADRIVDGPTDCLAPADPSRFPPGARLERPDPRFPLEPPAAAAPAPTPLVDGRIGLELAAEAESLRYLPLGTAEEIWRLDLPPLSVWFDGFLKRFLFDAYRVGGTAELAVAGGEVRGVYLHSPAEDVGSVFTRTAEVAHHYLSQRGKGGVYTDRPWSAGGEPLVVLAADLRDWQLRQPLRHPVRIATREDLPRVRDLMQELAGEVDDRWFGTLPRSDELCFLSEVSGRLAGVSWASVAGTFARGHSFMVRPRFRGLGVGTDLLHARMLWLQGSGVRLVVSEIYEGNAASEVAAERAGMAVVDRMYHYR